MTGTWRGIVADADIAGCRGVGQTVSDGLQRRSRQTFDPIVGLHDATVGAVNGHALCGGSELAMCCDLALVNERTKLGYIEIKLDTIPGGCGTRCLLRVLGSTKAKDILMTGRMMPATEEAEIDAALETGARHAFMPRAMELAEALDECAPVALRAAKRVVEDGLDAALNAWLTLEQRVLDTLFATEHCNEGIVAFKE